ncbi:GNAT family protein [Colletotrichum plurivorum]|uniref:GNAT family protein n=1 Tax=Colletotrichum plurivorum TaxID=2175906 RepID=A0A8H6JHV9_9PEZI|nr:GNAT family protein [Colletotrichum plurivorum]
MATIHTTVPEGLLPLLESHLPNSLPLLRRLQFTRFPGGQRPSARIIQSSSGEAFAAAYLDFGSGIETSLFMYSSLERFTSSSSSSSDDHKIAAEGDKAAAQDRTAAEDHIIAIIDAARLVSKEQPDGRGYPGAVLAGTVASVVREAMIARGVEVRQRQDYEYEKWLFRIDEVPDFAGGVVLPEGATWERADERDCEVVISRTHIPRQVKTLMSLPSLVLKLEDGTPIAWSFLGTDGSLSSLHCEEPYRKRGYAKALAAQLFKRSTGEYGSDGWASADVAPDNLGSRGMCKSLGGRHAWNVSWNIIQLDEEVKN